MPKKKIEIRDGFDAMLTAYQNRQCSTIDLAKQFNVSKATVLKWMDAKGVKRHQPGEMISVKMMGVKSRLGAKHSAESKEKMSASRKGKQSTLGFKFSDKSKEKMRVAAKKRIAETDSLQKMMAGVQLAKLPIAESTARKKARDACKRMLRRVLAMARIKKDGRRSELLLGYTKEQLRAHIESQFKDGMAWDKRDSFHIDHIKPMAQFFREGVYDPAVINALSNLQVLTPEENRKKSDSFSNVGNNRMAVLTIDSAGTRAFA